MSTSTSRDTYYAEGSVLKREPGRTGRYNESEGSPFHLLARGVRHRPQQVESQRYQ